MATDADHACAQVFRRQHGLISHQQALDCGMSPSTITRRVSSGLWARPGRGVYRHAASADTWRGRVLSLCMRFGGVASHRTAARLWELDGIRDSRPEIVIDRPTSPLVADVRIHRSTQFDFEPVRRDGIPVTPVERTLIDLGGVVGASRFETAVDDALRRSLTDWPALLSCYRQCGRRGRNGSAALRALLDERFGDTHIPLSAWSRTVQRQLLDAGLPAAVLEYPIRDAHGRLIAQVDLAYPEQRLAIELQSVAFHLDRETWEADAVRAAEVAAAGWTWLPLTWRRQTTGSWAAIATIRAAFNRATQPNSVS